MKVAIKMFSFSVVIIAVYFIRRALLSFLSLLSVIYPWREASFLVYQNKGHWGHGKHCALKELTKLMTCKSRVISVTKHHTKRTSTILVVFC